MRTSLARSLDGPAHYVELDSTIEGPRHLTHLLGCRQVNTKITHISCLPTGMDGQRGAGDLRVAEALDGHQSPPAPFADDLEQTARLLRQIFSLLRRRA